MLGIVALAVLAFLKGSLMTLQSLSPAVASASASPAASVASAKPELVWLETINAFGMHGLVAHLDAKRHVRVIPLGCNPNAPRRYNIVYFTSAGRVMIGGGVFSLASAKRAVVAWLADGGAV